MSELSYYNGDSYRKARQLVLDARNSINGLPDEIQERVRLICRDVEQGTLRQAKEIYERDSNGNSPSSDYQTDRKSLEQGLF